MKSKSNKVVKKWLCLFVPLFAVIIYNIIFNISFIDVIYLFVVVFYFIKCLRLNSDDETYEQDN